MMRSSFRFSSVLFSADLRKTFAQSTVAVLLWLVGGSLAIAQQYGPDSDIGMPGEELFQACAFCHGNVGQGRQRLDAPPIAGLQAWYVERQLHNFDNGIRGQHAEDLPGAQMDVVSGIFRNDASIANVAAYVETLEPGGPPVMRGRGEDAQPEPTERPFNWDSEYAFLNPPSTGDASRGQPLYQTCVVCHGAEGLGSEQLGAPNLAVLPSWYMARQLEYFQDGIRGANPQDIYGSQMVTFSKLLPNDQAIADVLAYIETL